MNDKLWKGFAVRLKDKLLIIQLFIAPRWYDLVEYLSNELLDLTRFSVDVENNAIFFLIVIELFLE